MVACSYAFMMCTMRANSSRAPRAQNMSAYVRARQSLHTAMHAQCLLCGSGVRARRSLHTAMHSQCLRCGSGEDLVVGGTCLSRVRCLRKKRWSIPDNAYIQHPRAPGFESFFGRERGGGRAKKTVFCVQCFGALTFEDSNWGCGGTHQLPL